MLVDLDLEGLEAFESSGILSIDGGSAFQVLTHPWGNDRAIVAFERTGRSRESRNKWLSESWCLVLGLSTGVSWAGSRGWSMVRLGEDRSAACTEGTGH